VIRDSEDLTISGLHVTKVWRDPAAMTIENCRRVNLSDCTILDCDHVGLLLRNVSNSRIAGCLIRDDRPSGDQSPSRAIQIEGGRGLMLTGNLLDSKIEGLGPHVHAFNNLVTPTEN
jgi:parallel beta-helix repeat protein